MKTNKLLSLLSAFTFVGVLGVAGPALALPIPEVEPNDSAPTATPLGIVPVAPSFVSGSGEVPDFSDTDFWSFTLSVASTLLAFTIGDEGTDTFIELFESDPLNPPNFINTTALASNNDCGDTRCDFFADYGLFVTHDPFSAFNPIDLPAGLYYIAVSLNDLGPSPYELVLSSVPLSSEVPEPASLLLLGSGLVGLVAWRRSLGVRQP